MWGCYHGLLLAGHRVWRQSRFTGLLDNAAGRALGVAVTFFLVTLGWVTFRAPDFGTTLLVLGELFGGSMSGVQAIPDSFWVLLGTSAAWTALDRGRRLQTWLCNGSGPLGALRTSSALALTLVVLELFSPSDVAIPFIYFEF